MQNNELIIAQTKKWITDVVIGCNFCPFAAVVIKQQTVYYQVEDTISVKICLDSFLKELIRLDDNTKIETSFLIFKNAVKQFDEYLKLLSSAEKLLKQQGYEGIYQLASFHPLYQFTGSLENDAANYTNRSVYPMLHLLREASIDKALKNYNSPEDIPERNINFARKKGLIYMKLLRDTCL
jgi:hypothetical protein